MKISMTQKEIEKAITAYLDNVLKGNFSYKIDIQATRGAAGFTAEIDLNSPTEHLTPKMVHTPSPASEMSRKTPSDPIVKEPVEPVTATLEDIPTTKRQSLFAGMKAP